MKTQNGWFLPALTMAILARRDGRGSTRGQESLQFERGLDPPLLPEDHLYERYRFSADGVRYLVQIVGSPDQTPRSTEPCAECGGDGLYGLVPLLQVGASLIGWRSRMKKQSHNLLCITEFVSGDESSGRCLYLLARPQKTQSNIRRCFAGLQGRETTNYRPTVNNHSRILVALSSSFAQCHWCTGLHAQQDKIPLRCPLGRFYE